MITYHGWLLLADGTVKAMFTTAKANSCKAWVAWLAHESLEGGCYALTAL